MDPDTIRKKFWGTDNPPGPKDPYNAESEEDRIEREEEEARREVKRLSDEGRRKYVKSTTTEGLETVGGPDWEARGWEMDPKNVFEGFAQLYCGYCDVY